jgi:hypothetical protein
MLEMKALPLPRQPGSVSVSPRLPRPARPQRPGGESWREEEESDQEEQESDQVFKSFLCHWYLWPIYLPIYFNNNQQYS